MPQNIYAFKYKISGLELPSKENNSRQSQPEMNVCELK